MGRVNSFNLPAFNDGNFKTCVVYTPLITPYTILLCIKKFSGQFRKFSYFLLVIFLPPSPLPFWKWFFPKINDLSEKININVEFSSSSSRIIKVAKIILINIHYTSLKFPVFTASAPGLVFNLILGVHVVRIYFCVRYV